MADGELLYAYGEWTEDERELLIICEKELLASTWELVAFAPWLQRTVVSWTTTWWQWPRCARWRRARR